MILPDTEPNLILKELQGEVEKVRYFVRKQRSSAKKVFWNAYTFPATYWASYTNPKSKNTYYAWFYAATREEAWREEFIGDWFLATNDSKGHRCLFILANTQPRPGAPNGDTSLISYTGHFFSRYRERALVPDSVSPIDLIVTCLGRNCRMMVELDFEKLNLNAGQYPDGSACQVRDGVVFVEQHELKDDKGLPYRYFIHRTFLSPSLLKEGQQAGYLSKRKLYNLLCDEIKKYVNKDSLPFHTDRLIDKLHIF